MPRDTVALLDTPADVTTLEGLAWRLRHPETWPTDFVWDYSDCRTCAMGLAYRLIAGPIKDPDYIEDFVIEHLPEVRDVADREQLSSSAEEIFYDLHTVYFSHKCGGGWRTQITPRMVADAIDAYLARERTNAV